MGELRRFGRGVEAVAVQEVVVVGGRGIRSPLEVLGIGVDTIVDAADDWRGKRGSGPPRKQNDRAPRAIRRVRVSGYAAKKGRLNRQDGKSLAESGRSWTSDTQTRYAAGAAPIARYTDPSNSS